MDMTTLTNRKIVPNFDYYTCVFYDSTFSDILSWLGLEPNIYVDEFLLNQNEINLGINVSKFFSYEHISLSCNLYEYLHGQCNIEVAFDTLFHHVRLDISGQGLKFLRRCGIDVDFKFRDLNNYPTEKYSVTRCDFSFDLVNYKPEFLDELVSYCRSNLTPTGCVQLMGKRPPLYCQINDACVRSVYLGKSRRILRVYDKKLESSDRYTGLYKKENDYDNPDSWIRIELQLRADKAHQMLFGFIKEGVVPSSDEYWLCVFRHIFEFYNFAQIEGTNSHNRVKADFWDKLFDWSEIPSIIQNEKSVQYTLYKDIVLADAGKIISRIQRDLARVYKEGGKESLQALSDSYYRFIFDYDDIRSSRPRDKELSRLNQLYTQGGIDIADTFDDCEFGYYRFHNTIRFKW